METFLKESISKEAAKDLIKFIELTNRFMILEKEIDESRKKKEK